MMSRQFESVLLYAGLMVIKITTKFREGKMKNKVLRHGLKALAVLLCSAIVIPAWGCEKPDLYKHVTPLFVSIPNDGFGSAWAESLEERFETAMKDISFEEGKMGVDVEIVVNENRPSVTNMINSRYDIVFSEGIPYADFVSNNIMVEINDVLTEDNRFDDNKKLESKLTDMQKDGLKAINGKYYAIPHTEYTTAITYDIEVFDKHGLYIRKDKSAGDVFVSEANPTKSAGPDGELGNSDDGLPVTYEEFFMLCDRMIDRGVVPLMYPGGYDGYMIRFVNSLATAYDGYESAVSNLNFTGKVQVVENFSTESLSLSRRGYTFKKPNTKLVEIDDSNGYLTRKSAGKYSALAFLGAIFANQADYFTKDTLSSTMTHVESQERFMYSGYKSTGQIGMLIDGNYWIGEATDSGAADRVMLDNGTDKLREYGFMRLPNRINDEDSNQVAPALLDMSRSFGFIHKNIDDSKLSLAKDFMRFAFSEESLQESTLLMKATRALQYDMTTEQLASMETYLRTLWDIKKEIGFVNSISSNPIYNNNTASLIYDEMYYAELGVGPESFRYPQIAIRKGYTVEEYFNGMGISKDAWEGYRK